MTETVGFQRTVEVRHTVDLLVAGGDVRAVAMKELLTRLQATGAYLPNA